MNYRFQIITTYEIPNIIQGGTDITSKSEFTVSLKSALRAAAIYWEDNTCSHISIYDLKADCEVLKYSPMYA